MRFQVLIATIIKIAGLWDVVPCSPEDNDRWFAGAYCLHHKGDRQTTVTFKTFYTHSAPYSSYLLLDGFVVQQNKMNVLVQCVGLYQKQNLFALNCQDGTGIQTGKEAV